MADEAENDSLAWIAACEDALQAVSHAGEWCLPEKTWPDVAEAIAQIARALASSDLDMLTQATISLELFSNVRTKVRAGDMGPASGKVLELRANTLASLQSGQGTGPAAPSPTTDAKKKS